MTIAVVNHCAAPAHIKNFSKQRYLSTQYMDRERQQVWQHGWLLAGLESDLQRAGDFFVFEVGAEQILVVRSRDGAIRAFFNVCQHRGNRLVTAERGHADSFRCMYHAWTYDTDGDLRIVPYQERFAQGVPRAERGLRPLHADAWDGFVFVSLQAEPLPLPQFLGPIVAHLAPYRFRQMVLVEDQTVEHCCNWKAVIDNFSELYHVDFLHPQHRKMVDFCNDTVHLFAHGHTGLAVPGATVNPRFPIPDQPTEIQAAQLRSLELDPRDFSGRVMDVRRAVQQRKREIGRRLGYDYSPFDDDQLSDVWQYNLFPNVILSFTPEHLWLMRVRPHASDPQRCYFDKMSFLLFADPQLSTTTRDIAGPGRSVASPSGQRSNEYVRPERDVFGHEAILRGDKTMTITIDQDIELLGQVQAGMNSAGFDSVWLNDDELRVQHFHNRLDEWMA